MHGEGGADAAPHVEEEAGLEPCDVTSGRSGALKGPRSLSEVPGSPG